MNFKNIKSITIGFLTALASFVLFIFGIMFVYRGNIDLRNVMVYFLVSVGFGAVAYGFGLLRYKSGLWLYLAGLLFGFIVMINTFRQDLDGWADLAALISLFMLAAGGLGAGLVAVMLEYLLKRRKNTI